MARDYYTVLGVGRDATNEEIKKAFRRIARETHPDTNPGDTKAEALFREAAEAYEVLSDRDRRAKHDRGDTVDLGDVLSGFGGLDDLLRSVFGDGGLFGGSTATRSARGRDVLVRTEVSLQEAVFGGQATVEFSARSTCPECSGSGAEPGSEQTTCPDCGGAGQVRVARKSLLGTMTSVAECPTCNGDGRLLTHPCHLCDGDGSVPDESVMSVEVPAGVSSGTRLRLSGRGESGGRFGPPGDLFVEVYVAEDPRFERVDHDLVHRVAIGVAEATLGSRLDVPLVNGESTGLEIPAGTQPRTTFRIRGEGVTHLGRRTRGDLIVVVDVEIPTQISDEQEDLLRRLAELRGEIVDRPAST